jgi:putative ABC transport system ATP-binding protein
VTATMPEAAVEALDITRVYGKPGTAGAVVAVDKVTLRFERGLVHAIVGPSGSGKSTLLHLLSTLDRPTSGTVLHGGKDVTRLSARAAARARQRTGFVFQRFNLVPSLNALQNITVPQQLNGAHVDQAWLSELVDRLGLGPRLQHHPHELSGGQQQRVAIARALLGRPNVLFADEPTGSLDSNSARDVTRLLASCAADGNTTVIVVTHDEQVAAAADLIVHVADGRVSGHTVTLPVQAQTVHVPPQSAAAPAPNFTEV